jgi:signal transduction histidine kinase
MELRWGGQIHSIKVDNEGEIIYQTIREAVFNVIKHSEAKTINVCCTIEDDGIVISK